MIEELKSKQKLYIYNGIDSQLEEIEDLADAKEYINDYMEGGDIHPDIESIIILQQVGGVYIEETGEFSELNGDTVPVCKVDVLIDKNDIDDYKEVLEDKRRLTLEIEKAMFGENGAKNPSLCDVLKSVIDMKSRIDELEKNNEWTQVSDRLPKLEIHTVGNITTRDNTYECIVSDGITSWVDYFTLDEGFHKSIIKWRPIPKP